MDEQDSQGTAGRCPDQQHGTGRDPDPAEASYPPEDVWDDSEDGAEDDDEEALPYWIDQEDED